MRLVSHLASDFAVAVVEEWICERIPGSSCILTWTNEEALRVFSCLLQKGVKARLVQSNDGFRLSDLAELRYFRQLVMKQEGASVISSKFWEEARRQLCEAYTASACLADCLALIDAFAETAHVKYKSDFDDFLNEAKIEDFGCAEKGTVTISTIHKSKGKEFDSVYIMLNGVEQLTDEKRRAIYVGITRAKKALRVHFSDSTLFSGIDADGVERVNDNRVLKKHSDVIVQLTHRDVVLDFFLDKKAAVCTLRSGEILDIDGYYLSASVNGRRMRVAKFSQTFVNRLSEFADKGYKPSFAKVRYVVAWKKEDAVQEVAVLLPDLYLSAVV